MKKKSRLVNEREVSRDLKQHDCAYKIHTFGIVIASKLELPSNNTVVLLIPTRQVLVSVRVRSHGRYRLFVHHKLVGIVRPTSHTAV